MDLDQYSELLTYLPWENRKNIATILVRSTLHTGTKLDTIEKIEKLFSAITPLLRDEAKDGDTPPTRDEEAAANGANAADFADEQTLVARLIHQMASTDNDAQFKIFSMARKQFGQGGVKRIQHTLVPLVFNGLALAQRVKSKEAADASVKASIAGATAKNEELQSEYKKAVEAVEEGGDKPPKPAPLDIPAAPVASTVSCRKVLQFLHEIVTAMATTFPDLR